MSLGAGGLLGFILSRSRINTRNEKFRREYPHAKGGTDKGFSDNQRCGETLSRWDLVGKCIPEESRKCAPGGDSIDH